MCFILEKKKENYDNRLQIEVYSPEYMRPVYMSIFEYMPIEFFICLYIRAGLINGI